MVSSSQIIRRLCLLASAILTFALAAGSAQAADVSSNWAGYVAVPASSVGSPFASVSGSWTEPTAMCTMGRESYSAVWVGLGGARESATSLEQVGTDADCSSAGRPVYSSWFELLPAEAVGVRLAVHPGDRMTASVTVRGHDATLRLRDLSSGGRFTITRRMAKVDVSTAEWIVEAPSICLGTGACRTDALTDFGAVEFSATSATAHGHTGPIADPEWSTTALELRQSSLTGGRRGTAAVGVPSSSLIEASPSSAAGPEGAFAVRWQEQAVQGERSAPPTLPGASGAG
jgi:hypothetical protein